MSPRWGKRNEFGSDSEIYSLLQLMISLLLLFDVGTISTFDTGCTLCQKKELCCENRNNSDGMSGRESNATLPAETSLLFGVPFGCSATLNLRFHL